MSQTIPECQNGPCMEAIAKALRNNADHIDSYKGSGLPGLDDNGDCARCGSDLVRIQPPCHL